jgi:tetratricopeptide (TPR) repeat protein
MTSYDAFISYSHARDKPIAAALQSVMQTLGKPWYRRRALRIFRDDTSLSATPHLWPSIEFALGQSRFFILFASPEAAASKWVNKEVAYWLDHNSIDTLLIGVTGGELAWEETTGDFRRHEATPLPAVLAGRFVNEPKWVDLRPYRDGADPRNAKFIELGADFAAAIRGMPKEDLLSQEVRLQRRALTLASSVAGILTVLIALAGWQWWEAERAKKAAVTAEVIATEQKKIAQTQRDRAERNFGIARQAANDVVVKLADNLRDIQGMRVDSLRHILDTAQALMDGLAKAEPDDPLLQDSRGSMLVSYTQTYLAAGDLSRAVSAAEESLAIYRKLSIAQPDIPEWPRRASSALGFLGDARRAAGDQPGALAAYEEGLAIIRKIVAEGHRMYGWQSSLSSSLNRVGDMRLAAGDHSGALAHYEESYAIRRKLDTDAPNVDRYQRELFLSLINIGNVWLAAAEWAKALAAFEESLAIVRRLALADQGNVGRQHDLSIVLVKVGVVRFSMGDRAGALAAFEESLPIVRSFAAGDPANSMWQVGLAVSLNNVGEVADPTRAREVLPEALSILDGLAREGKLTAAQRDWPQKVRDLLARLPPEIAQAK